MQGGRSREGFRGQRAQTHRRAWTHCRATTEVQMQGRRGPGAGRRAQGEQPGGPGRVSLSTLAPRSISALSQERRLLVDVFACPCLHVGVS